MSILGTLEYLAQNPTQDVKQAVDSLPDNIKEAYKASNFLATRSILSEELSKSFPDMSHCNKFPDMSHG